MNATTLSRFRSFAGTTALLAMTIATAAAQPKPFLPLPASQATTVPANGDVNPYGVAYVPRSVPSDGILRPGDVLVSNFNNAENLQGTGTTIVRITAAGETSLFYQNSKFPGMSAALGVLANGNVIVGNLPTADGTGATVQPGSLLVINRFGTLINVFNDPTLKAIDGPWGLTIHEAGNDAAQIFFSNVLSGIVTRLDVNYDEKSVVVRRAVTVAAGYNHRVDPAALVLGPSGLAYDAGNDVLFVASSADNAIYAVQQARTLTASTGTGRMIYQDNVHLHGPLDLIIAPNGHLVVANSDGSNTDPNQPSELVEFTANGQFVSQFSLDPNNGGAFGLNLQSIGWGTYRVAAVDDNQNILRMWTTTVQ